MSADTVAVGIVAGETFAGPPAEAPAEASAVASAVVEPQPVTAPTADEALLPAHIAFAAVAVER